MEVKNMVVFCSRKGSNEIFHACKNASKIFPDYVFVGDAS